MNHVAFDIGNVICHVDFTEFEWKFTEYLSRYMGTEDVNIHKFINYRERLDYLGIHSLADSLKLHYKFTYDEIDNLVDLWNKSVSINTTMLNLIKSLKKERIDIALLSNLGLDHAKYLKEICPELFEMTIPHLSCEVGSFKPQKLFFQSFLMQYPEFKGCLYFDDRQENLEMGQEFKFKPYLFDLSLETIYKKTHNIKIRNKQYKKQDALFKEKIKAIKNEIITKENGYEFSATLRNRFESATVE